MFLLDSKNLWGALAVEDGVLVCHHPIAPQSDYALLSQPKRCYAAARTLQAQLSGAIGWTPDVIPVLVLWAAFDEETASVNGTRVVRGDTLTEWLEQQPKRLAPQDQDAISAVLAALPAAATLSG